MKKKLLIIFGSVLGVIAVLVILLFTLFAVRSAKVDFRTSTTENMPSSEEILEAAEIPYWRPTLFVKKSKITKRIEEKYPYAEVVNIETVFPCTLVVHIKEREEIYAINSQGKTYYCDNTLKVLRVEEGLFISKPNNSILVTGIEVSEETQAGDRLVCPNYVDVYDSLLANNRALFEQIEMIKSIDFSSFKDANTGDSSPCLTICTYDEHLYYVYNSHHLLTQKMSKFLAVFGDLYDRIGQRVSNIEGSENYDKFWTLDMLKSAYIVINNEYINQNNVYANVLPSGNS